VFVNGEVLKNSPYIYTVSPSSLNSALGYVSSDHFLVYAGNEITFLIKVFDKYKNLLVDHTDLLIKSNTGQFKIIDYNQGCYRVKGNFTQIGKHSLVLTVNEAQLEFVVEDYRGDKEVVEVSRTKSIDLQVLPGIICPNTCEVVGIKSQYVVGECAEFRIVTKDAFGNTTWHRTAQWDIRIEVSFEVQESNDSCATWVKFTSLKAGLRFIQDKLCLFRGLHICLTLSYQVKAPITFSSQSLQKKLSTFNYSTNTSTQHHHP
jgi:hypothetical protein